MLGETREKLVSLIRARVEEGFGVDPEDSENLTGFLTQICDLEEDDAEALAWGNELPTDRDALGRIAAVFALSPDLFLALCSPMSNEVLHHTIVASTSGELNAGNCPVCDELQERVDEATPNDSLLDLEELCIELLQHMMVTSAEDYDDYDDNEMVIPVAFAAVLSQLSPEARLRVLAYAYQELAQTTDGRHAQVFAAYVRLRAE